MDKNEFDLDFDFKQEYGFDPEEFLSSENPGEFDLTQFDEDLAINEGSQVGSDEYEYDASASDFDEDLTSGIDFFKGRGQNDFQNNEMTEDYVPEEYDQEYDPEEYYQEEDNQNYNEQEYTESSEGDYEDNYPEQFEDEEVPVREKKKLKIKMPKLPKLPKRKKSDKPTLFSKFIALYFGPLMDKNYGKEPAGEESNGHRRRRPTRNQILKEVYLPPIILCLALLLILSMTVGALSNKLKLKKLDDAQKKQDAQLAEQEENQAERQFQLMMDQAEELATGYDFDGAVSLLTSFATDNSQLQQTITEKKSEYVNAKSTMKEWKDVNAIANLSFHVLIQDPQRAFSSESLKGQYNRNFVTTGEFEKILNQLYSGGYVLVDFDSFVGSTVGLDGNKIFSYEPVLLPAGKKPVMITETMVNYFEYMVDGDKDGEADARGDGFASKLVLTQTGEIKAEYVDAGGQKMTGNYDLVPILEDFIKEHPDFSYRGARATLAVTGTEGVFGYRTNTTYISKKGQDYYEQQVAEARVLVDALREKGYTIACYTYNNENYRNLSVNQIKTDVQAWASQITPVVGDVDVMVFARSSDIDDYSGNKFNVLYDAGFRYFVGNAAAPKADVNSTFVRQSRLMVTGNAMGWSASQFAQYFDPNVVLDMASRGTIPNG